MSITITLSHDVEALVSLRDEWIDLQARSSATGIALTWHGIYTWYKYFGKKGELWLITARKDNRLIGIAPLIKVKEKPDRGFAWQQIEFIGTSDDHERLDFLIEADYEQQIIPLFIDKLYKHRSQWDVIVLSGLSDTKTIDILQQSDYEWVEYPEKELITPYIPLPDTMDEWMESLSSKRRWSLRRDFKKLDEQFPDRWSIIQITQPDELDEKFEHLVRLHQARWEAVGERGSLSNTERTNYIRELLHYSLENGWLRMYCLNIDDQPCAIDLCYHYRGRAYGHLTSTNRDITSASLGLVLKHHSIDRAISEGCREFTLGEGGQSYKYSFGGVDRIQQAFRLIASPRVRLQIKAIDELRKVKSRLRQLRAGVNEKTTDRPLDKVDKD